MEENTRLVTSCFSQRWRRRHASLWPVLHQRWRRRHASLWPILPKIEEKTRLVMPSSDLKIEEKTRLVVPSSPKDGGEDTPRCAQVPKEESTLRRGVPVPWERGVHTVGCTQGVYSGVHTAGCTQGVYWCIYASLPTYQGMPPYLPTMVYTTYLFWVHHAYYRPRCNSCTARSSVPSEGERPWAQRGRIPWVEGLSSLSGL